MPAVTRRTKLVGGSFLLEAHSGSDVFTPEDLNLAHQNVTQIVRDFAHREIGAAIERIEQRDFHCLRELIRKLSGIGPANAGIADDLEGPAYDAIAAAVIHEHSALCGSISVSFGAHSCTGMLPIVCFGTAQQKAKYLPKLSTGEWVAACALSESIGGTDALGARATAVISPDGKEWILNGEKVWVTNGGFADLLIVFARADGSRFSAFIVERTSPGLSTAPEIAKSGLRGSSTCSVLMNDCHIPKENLLGEIGKGHAVVFSALNMGRLNLGAAMVGSALHSLRDAVSFARGRKTFDSPLASFALTREKIGRMAAGIYSGKSILYRTAGMIDAALSSSANAAEGADRLAEAFAEYAIECSIVKVWCSEMLGYVADECLQIHGSSGFIEGCLAERAYRDARLWRVVQGTNEINRMAIVGLLRKRSDKGEIAMISALRQLAAEGETDEKKYDSEAGPLAAERAAVAGARKAGLMLTEMAGRRYGMELANRQDVGAALADFIMELYAMDSAILRAQKVVDREGEIQAQSAIALAQAGLVQSLEKSELAARRIVSATSGRETFRRRMDAVQHRLRYTPPNYPALFQEIAKTVVADSHDFPE